MKRLNRLLLALALALVVAVPAWPASLTLTNQRHHVTGDVRVVTGTSAVNSGDTYAVPLKTIELVIYTVRTTSASPAGPANNVSHAISGTTVTFYTTTDGLTWEFYIVGY